MKFDLNGPSGPLQIAVVLLLGLATVGYGVYSYDAQTSALDSAETVNATVVATSVETNDNRRGVDYSPNVTFNYTYAGTAYTTSNVYPGPLPREFDTEDAARAELSDYEPGDTVTAYVPTDAPGTAFLKQERSDKPFLVIGLGLLFVLGGGHSALREFVG